MFSLSRIACASKKANVTFPSAHIPLVSTQVLASNVNNVRILDASWLKLPSFVNRDGLKEHAEKRIPGSQYFDLDVHCDKSSKFPHMLPPVDQFKETMKKFNIGISEHVVCYDSLGVYSSPRLYWTLKHFGYENVSVLDGGLKKWIDEGLPLETGPVLPPVNAVEIPDQFSVDSSLVVDYPTIKRNVQLLNKNKLSEAKQIIDARSAPRFRGEAEEPWPVPSGHMMGAKNVPFVELLDAVHGTYLPVETLRRRLCAYGFDPKNSSIFTCGSGITACVPWLAVEVVRAHDRILLADVIEDVIAKRISLPEAESRAQQIIMENACVEGSAAAFSKPFIPLNGAAPPSSSVFDGAWVEWCTREAEIAQRDMDAFLLNKSLDSSSGPVKLDAASRNLGLSLSTSKGGVVGPVRLTEASAGLSASKGGVLYESSDDSDEDADALLEPLATRLNRSKDGSLSRSTRRDFSLTGKEGNRIDDKHSK